MYVRCKTFATYTLFYHIQVNTKTKPKKNIVFSKPHTIGREGCICTLHFFLRLNLPFVQLVAQFSVAIATQINIKLHVKTYSSQKGNFGSRYRKYLQDENRKNNYLFFNLILIVFV